GKKWIIYLLVLSVLVVLEARRQKIILLSLAICLSYLAVYSRVQSQRQILRRISIWALIALISLPIVMNARAAYREHRYTSQLGPAPFLLFIMREGILQTIGIQRLGGYDF